MTKEKMTYLDEIAKSTLSIGNDKENSVPFYKYGVFGRMRWIRNITGSYLDDVLIYI